MLLSVIVPVYKVETYIRKCIDSIINQDFENYELILVDDGSPDKCGEICDEYSKINNNIKVIHQKNQGVSCARNIGLQQAKGKYICFVDADDYIEKGYFQEINDIIKDNYDIIKFGDTKEEKVYNGFKDLLSNDKYSGTLWSYVIKKELFDIYKIKFPLNVSHSEDHCVLFQLISVSRNIRTINKVFYRYQNREDSAIHQKLTHKAADSHLNALYQILLFFHNRKIKDTFYYKRTIKGINLYFVLLAKIPIREFSIKHAKNSLRKFKKDVINFDKSIKNNFFIKNSNLLFLCIITSLINKIIKK